MAVVLLRHYRVVYRWRAAYTPEGFRAAQDEYDQADVIDQGKKPPVDCQQVLSSTLKRAVQTVNYLCGDRPSTQTPLLKEVRMEPFTDKPKPYQAWLLNVVARLQWLLNSRRQPETRAATIRRANQFIDQYLAGGESCLVVSHGLFIRMLAREMIRRGFKGRRIEYLANGEYRIYHPPDTGLT